MVKIGIIDGSGLDNPKILRDYHEKEVVTPYGKPSSSIKIGKINNLDVVLVARHGHSHSIPPTEINNRAKSMP